MIYLGGYITAVAATISIQLLVYDVNHLTRFAGDFGEGAVVDGEVMQVIPDCTEALFREFQGYAEVGWYYFHIVQAESHVDVIARMKEPGLLSETDNSSHSGREFRCHFVVEPVGHYLRLEHVEER